jgi:hypothetical protein
MGKGLFTGVIEILLFCVFMYAYTANVWTPTPEEGTFVFIIEVI